MSVSFEYIDGDGGTYTLATASRRKLMAFGGMGMVSPEHYWQPRPYRDGDEHLGFRVPRRTVNFLVTECAATRGSAWGQKGDIATAFSPHKGEGRLRATLPNGTVRVVSARLAGGLDFSTQDSPTPLIQDFPIQLVCGSPHWEDPTYGSASVNLNGSTPVTVTCVNSGDVATYPTLTLDAPVNNPVIELVGGGQIEIDVNVTSGSLVVDCDDPAVTVGTVSKMGSAALTSDFFALSRGTNTIRLTADSGTQACTVRWVTRHEVLKP